MAFGLTPRYSVSQPTESQPRGTLETRLKNSRQTVAVAREERAASLLNRNARPLKNVEDLLMRTRVDLAELKRTGARESWSELLADMTKLKSELEQLQEPLEADECAPIIFLGEHGLHPDGPPVCIGDGDSAPMASVRGRHHRAWCVRRARTRASRRHIT